MSPLSTAQQLGTPRGGLSLSENLGIRANYLPGITAIISDCSQLWQFGHGHPSPVVTQTTSTGPPFPPSLQGKTKQSKILCFPGLLRPFRARNDDNDCGHYSPGFFLTRFFSSSCLPAVARFAPPGQLSNLLQPAPHRGCRERKTGAFVRRRRRPPRAHEPKKGGESAHSQTREKHHSCPELHGHYQFLISDSPMTRPPLPMLTL